MKPFELYCLIVVIVLLACVVTGVPYKHLAAPAVIALFLGLLVFLLRK